jgi:hypothetical protein
VGHHELMPRKALKAAAALGDRDAIEELQIMRTNSLWAFLGLCTTVVVVAVIVFGFQYCGTKDEADVALRRQEMELKRSFVERCALPPDLSVKVQR